MTTSEQNQPQPGPWASPDGQAWLLAGEDPEFLRAADRHFEHEWPLVYFQIHGIEIGKQWAVLGWLAARYARDFSVDELAHELREVVEASDHSPHRPWREHQVRDIARRAKRFIERADAQLLASGAMEWAIAAA